MAKNEAVMVKWTARKVLRAMGEGETPASATSTLYPDDTDNGTEDLAVP